MVRRSFVTLFAGCFACFGLLVMGGHDPVSAAAKTASKTANKKPITNPKFDPNGEEVELFAAMEAGQVEVKVIPKNALAATVLIENKTDKPLNVKVPEAVIAAPIHAQMGGMGGMGMGGGMGGMGGGMGGGGQQMMGGGMGGGGMGGGGMGGMGGGMGGMGGGGGGFFSVPPERIIAVKFNSVCLQHGRPDPTSSSKYQLMPVSRVSKDPVLYELLSTVGTGKVDAQAAQAAAWSISDKMNWQQLANKSVEHLGGQAPTPYFTQEQLFAGQMLLAQSVERSETRKEDQKDPKTSTPAPRSGRAAVTK
ncbi:MAG TPA: hypothetical protein VGM98_03775 [Schlesneria sp.]